MDIKKHPSEDAPKNWNVVQVSIDENKDNITVVCGGDLNYKIGDFIPYRKTIILCFVSAQIV